MTHEIQIASLIALLALAIAYTIRIIAQPPELQLLRRIIELEKQVKELEACSAALQSLQDEMSALRGENMRLVRIALAAASVAQRNGFQEASNAPPATADIWQQELTSALNNLARLQKQAGTFGSNTPPELKQEIERTTARIRELENQLDLYHTLNPSDHANQS